jgi:hypothetical protein
VSGTTDDDHESSERDELSAKLTANPSTISPGQSSTLTWTTTDADDVYLDGVSVSKSGSKIVSPSSTTTYTLVAVDGNDRVSSSATVTVSGSGSSVVSANLTASPTAIQAGQSSTLSWTTGNAAYVYLDGVLVTNSGTKTVSPLTTTTYNLEAINGTTRVTDTATVTVSTPTPPPPPPPAMPTASLTANPTSIQSGASSTLTWSTTNATSVTLNGAAVALSGSQPYMPTMTTTYTLVASNSAGSATATATVTVTAPPPPMPTALLTANPMSIQSGQSSTLSWATANATTVTLDGGAVSANGSRAVFPTTTKTYKLVATNSSGSVSSSVTVTVTAPPPPALTWSKDMQPIFTANCTRCHGGSSPTAGLTLETYAGTMKVVTAGDPNSKLIQMTKPGGQMYGFLSNGPVQSDLIFQWVMSGAQP